MIPAARSCGRAAIHATVYSSEVSGIFVKDSVASVVQQNAELSSRILEYSLGMGFFYGWMSERRTSLTSREARSLFHTDKGRDEMDSWTTG